MTGRFLIDTNVIIEFLNGDANIIAKFGMHEDIYLSIITLGELYYGAYNSSRTKKNIEIIQNLAKELFIFNCNENTSKIYGEVKKRLKENGTPLPENDIWISAIAIQYDLTLVTQDKHFNNVDMLRLAHW